MDAPLDDAEYLVRSENRIAVLELLAEGPRERRDVQHVIGVSRATIGRLFGEFVDRGWIERRGHEHHITPLGRMVVEDLGAFLRTIGTAQTLRAIQPYLPVEAFDFDLRRLADAEISTPHRSNAVAHLTAAAARLPDADLVRIVGTQFDIVHVGVAAAQFGARPYSAEHHCVFLDDSLETVAADPELAAALARILELSHTTCYRHPGEFPCTLTICDGTVAIELNDGSGFVPAVVISDDEAVVAWAVDVFERHKQEAEPIDPAVFAVDRRVRRRSRRPPIRTYRVGRAVASMSVTTEHGRTITVRPEPASCGAEFAR